MPWIDRPARSGRPTTRQPRLRPPVIAMDVPDMVAVVPAVRPSDTMQEPGAITSTSSPKSL